ncbi:MAG: GNAT family N-acetyltransferase [Bacteroidales bacterium]|nr:GNAT family N-acetyltransferase [Bacteroidales bacterium]
MKTQLRAPEPSDLDFLYRLENDPDVRRVSWGECPMSRQLLWDYLSNYTPEISRDRQLRLVIENVDGERIGAIDWSDYDPVNRRAMIGIGIDKRYRGQGYGVEAMEQAVQFSRESLALHQLAAIVAKSNEGSVALFKQVGFGVSGCLRSWVRQGTGYDDALVMQLIL